MKLNFNKKSKGFTLIEILLVVGFISLASIGVYTIYNKVQIGNQANQEGRNIDTLRAGIKGLYGASSEYSTITNTVVNQARVTPQSLRSSNPLDVVSITNSFGGNVTVTPVSLGGGVNNGFRITYPRVTADVCVKMVTTTGAQFDQVGAGAFGNIKAFGTSTVLPAAAAINCNAAGALGIDVTFDSL